MSWGTIMATLGSAASTIGTKVGETAVKTGVEAAGKEGLKKVLMKGLEEGASWAVEEGGKKLAEEAIKGMTEEGLKKIVEKGGQEVIKKAATQGAKNVGIEVAKKVGTQVTSDAISDKATPDEEQLTEFGANDLLSHALTGASIIGAFIPGVGQIGSLAISAGNMAFKMATDAKEAKAKIEELTKEKSLEMKRNALTNAKKGLLGKVFKSGGMY